MKIDPYGMLLVSVSVCVQFSTHKNVYFDVVTELHVHGYATISIFENKNVASPEKH